MSLLPSHHDEFRSKEYWDRFFLERGGEQFEWYGSYSEIEGHVKRSVKSSDSLLIIGCGNSEISADLFDNGFRTVTNIDFSPLVIDEMISKNQYRPSMKWHVGDMTCMPQYGDALYDVVFDKGALDALMSEDTLEVQEKASAMFREIGRLLSVGGRYVCITLAESFIIKALLAHFTAQHWAISVESVQHGKSSPFKPFYITITKPPTTPSPSAPRAVPSDVALLVDSLGNDAQSRSVRPSVAVEEEYNQKRFELGEVRVGRFEHMDYTALTPPGGGVGQGAKHAAGEVPRFTVTLLDAARTATRSCVVFFVPSGRESEFQFSTQLGLQGIAAEAQCRRLLAVRCNRPHVFPAMTALQAELSPIAMSLKPRDMSSDEMIPYMALEADGNWETLEYGRADVSGEYIVEEEPDQDRPNGVTRRLVFLQNQNFIQTEIKMIERRDSSKSSKAGSKGAKKGKDKKKEKRDGSGEGVMEFDYSYLDEHHKAVLSSLVLSSAIINGGSKVSPSSGTNRPSDPPLGVRVPSALIVGLGGGAMPMCLQRYLPGLRLVTCELDGHMHDIAIKFFAFKCNPRSNVVICEGMGLIERVARKIEERRRGASGPGSRSAESVAAAAAPIAGRAGVDGEDGTGAGAEGEGGLSDLMDLLFIDADSKDPSLGLSAPPKAFITPQALRTMYQVLQPGGILALNVVARTSSLLGDLVEVVKRSFAEGEAEDRERQRRDEASTGSNSNSNSVGCSANGDGDWARERSRVYLLKASDETANTTLLVVKGGARIVPPSPPLAAPPKSTGKKKTAPTPVWGPMGGPGLGLDEGSLRTAREGAIEDWLKVVGMSSDPLELVSLIAKLKPA